MPTISKLSRVKAVMISWPDEWLVEHRKIVDYLLNIDHPHGRPKARAFLRAGFSRSEPERLIEALLAHVSTARLEEVEGTYGTLMVFEGALVAPNKTLDRLRSVWLLKSGEKIARLVTAYPYDERTNDESGIDF